VAVPRVPSVAAILGAGIPAAAVWLLAAAASAQVPGPDFRDWLPDDEVELAADRLVIGPGPRRLLAERLRLSVPGVVLRAERAERDDGGDLRLLDARLSVDLPGRLQGHGAAAEAALGDGGLVLAEGEASRCPLDAAGWRITFGEACAGRDGDVELSDVRFRLGDVPVLWAPWMLLRFGRVPGLVPPGIGSRPGRGPFLRLGAFLPAGPVGDFEVAFAGFPLDDLDVSAAWTYGSGTMTAGAGRLFTEPRVFVRSDTVERPRPSGAVVGRGIWAQPGFEPEGSADVATDAEAEARFASIRADRFALFGHPFAAAAVGAATWQPVRDGRAGLASLAVPRARIEWFPGWWDDRLRAPGALRIGVWRPLQELFDETTPTAVGIAWRQGFEGVVPGIPGVDLRPFVVTAGARRGDAESPAQRTWTAAGARASFRLERSWEEARVYHRWGIDLRYARTLHRTGSGDGLDDPFGPGSDLLRLSLPQRLRLGGVIVAADGWAELRRLDAWDPASAGFGLELSLRANAYAVRARGILDGDAFPRVVATEAVLALGEPVELSVRYLRATDGAWAAAGLLDWEERALGWGPGGAPLLHGVAGEIAVRFLAGRLHAAVRIEADLDAGAIARVGGAVGWQDPAACLGVRLAATWWMDDPIPAAGLMVTL
jgi:hypothetical protein